MSRITLDLQRQSRLWPRLVDIKPMIRRAAQAAVARSGVPTWAGATIAIALADDATIRDVNRSFRGFDKPTNVLSFPAAPRQSLPLAPMLGDIMIAFETVDREARQEERSFEAHLSHLVVHGVLHLLGFDHETDHEAEEMEALESAIVTALGWADPYAGSVAETARTL
jgi:probable rRNA maturation factor